MSEGQIPPSRRPPNRRAHSGRPPFKDRIHNAPPFNRQAAVDGLKKLLDSTVREMNLAVEYEIGGASDSDGSSKGTGDGEPEVIVRFRGDDEELLLARNGELLLAMEYLAHRCLRLDPMLHDRVRFDCGDFRTTRLEELKLSARVAAQRVRETGQPFRFNPMPPRDRRIVHLELNGAPGVRTRSEGTGDRRQLVIYPATKTK
jgi:spoIIIJ-associated protein